MNPTSPVDGAAKPLFSLLGTHQANGGCERYVIKTSRSLIVLRAEQMCSVPFLLSLVPDIDHWRSTFPRKGGKVDSNRAAAWLIAECQKAGPVDLPAELRPRPIGRQKGWHKGVDFAVPENRR